MKIILAGLPAYTTDEFLFKLKVFGVEFDRNGKGDHDIFYNKYNGQISPIPIGSQSINPMTMKRIVDRLGIPWEIWKKTPKRPKTRDMLRFKDQILMLNQEPSSDQFNIDIPAPEVEEVPEWQNQPWYVEQQKKLQGI